MRERQPPGTEVHHGQPVLPFSPQGVARTETQRPFECLGAVVEVAVGHEGETMGAQGPGGAVQFDPGACDLQHAAHVAGQDQLIRLIEEGSADFLSELLTGDTISDHLETFAAGREAEIWEQFEAAMNGTDVSRWLYNGGSATTEWPADLGYWVGAQITRAYYEQAANKSDAVREILNIRDFNAFLIQSKYADQFE